jgi:hypothetical protein
MLVRENLQDFLEFHRDDEDPLDKLNIGIHNKIKDWMRKFTEFEEDEYRINEDGTIDLLDDINISGQGLEKLPDFIKFNIAYRSFYASHNRWESLEGFPKEVMEDFSINFQFYGAKHWKKDEIENLINVHGTIYN